MQEIEVREYVRTDEGIIQKCTDIDNNYIYADDILSYNFQGDIEIPNDYIEKTRIVKHSKNIIDLIEVGDIIEIYFPIKQKKRKIFVDEYFKDSMVLDGIIQKRIILKSIATKEQIAGIEYKI